MRGCTEHRHLRMGAHSSYKTLRRLECKAIERGHYHVSLNEHDVAALTVEACSHLGIQPPLDIVMLNTFDGVYRWGMDYRTRGKYMPHNETVVLNEMLSGNTPLTLFHELAHHHAFVTSTEDTWQGSSHHLLTFKTPLQKLIEKFQF